MRATLIIKKENQILLIHRFNNNFNGGFREYFVFPGGGIEVGESLEEAVMREAKEETNFDVTINKKLFEHKDENDSRIHHVFLITEFS